MSLGSVSEMGEDDPNNPNDGGGCDLGSDTSKMTTKELRIHKNRFKNMQRFHRENILGRSNDLKEGRVVHIYEMGDHFGELSLMPEYPETRHQWVTAVTAVKVQSVSRNAFREFPRSAMKKMSDSCSLYFIARVLLEDNLSKDELWAIAQSLEVEHVTAGTKIITEGEPGMHIHFLEMGKLEVRPFNMIMGLGLG